MCSKCVPPCMPLARLTAPCPPINLGRTLTCCPVTEYGNRLATLQLLDSLELTHRRLFAGLILCYTIVFDLVDLPFFFRKQNSMCGHFMT